MLEKTDQEDIPQLTWEFTSIGQLDSVVNGTLVDLLGVAVTDGPVESFQGKDGKSRSRRTILLTDTSMKDVAVTLWGTDAEAFVFHEHEVICLGRALKSEFDGKPCLSCSPNTIFWCAPTLTQAKELQDWFREELKNYM